MSKQLGLASTLGVVVLNETKTAQFGLPGVIINESSGTGTVTAAGTANGQASVSGVPVGGTFGTANGQASAAGGWAATTVMQGIAQGQASVSGGTTGIVVSAAGTANGQASVREGAINALALADTMLSYDDYVAGSKGGLGWAWDLNLTQVVHVIPTRAPVFLWGRTLTQAMTVKPHHTPLVTYSVVDHEIVTLTQALLRTYPVVLSQALTFHQAQVVATAVILLQRLKLIPTHIPLTHYHLGLVQALVVNQSFARFLAASLSQAIGLHAAAPLRTFIANPQLTQAMTLHGALANTLVLSFHDTIDIHPVHLLHMIYQGDVLTDGLNLQGLYVLPNGMVTTWAVNTRTSAITEYSHYKFNGFAQMGLRYIGTNQNGVYELDGEQDDCRNIIADIVSSFAQMNGTKMSGLKGIYLGLRGRGEFFFKVLAGDDREYTYKVLTQPGLMNTKINVGKGMRTRYMAFELISTGSDFDLDTVEFVPMMSDRRV